MSTKFYVNAEGSYLGGFDGVQPPAGAIEVPTAPEDARQVWGELGWGVIPDATAPVQLCQVAGARLLVDQDAWEVTGIDRSTGIAGAFLVDTDLVYVFFAADAVQPDTIYDVIPREGVTKHEDYVEVMRPGLAELNFIVQRVQ